MYNNPEGLIMEMWTDALGVELDFILPGEPIRNSCIERFKRTNNEYVLDFVCFDILSIVCRRSGSFPEVQ